MPLFIRRSIFHSHPIAVHRPGVSHSLILTLALEGGRGVGMALLCIPIYTLTKEVLSAFAVFSKRCSASQIRTQSAGHVKGELGAASRFAGRDAPGLRERAIRSSAQVNPLTIQFLAWKTLCLSSVIMVLSASTCSISCLKFTPCS